VSRTVAQDAATQLGLDPGLLKRMLPIWAMLVAGYMAKQRGAGAAAQPPQRATGLAPMLDLNRDGNPLDDILRMAGKALRWRRA
jgi:hypothetical protein